MLREANWDFPLGVQAGTSCFDGHFPDNPIVPGAYLLALAEDRLKRSGWLVTEARRIKFLSPLGPDVPFQIQAIPGSKATTLRWIRDNLKFAEASLILRSSAV